MARRFCLQIFVYKFRHAVKKQSDNILNLYLLFQPCNSSLPSPHLQRVSLVFQFYSETVSLCVGPLRRYLDFQLPSVSLGWPEFLPLPGTESLGWRPPYGARAFRPSWGGVPLQLKYPF